MVKAASSILSKSSSDGKAVKTTKYASKFVCQRMDNIIEKKILSLTVNPKSTRKWAEKMKLSVLKKISAGSITVFAGASKSKAILEQINDVKAKISERKSSIEKLLKSINQIHSQAINCTMATDVTNPEIKKIEPISGKIKNAIQSIGERLRMLTKTIHQQADALQESLQAVESQMSTSSSSSSSSSSRLLDVSSSVSQQQRFDAQITKPKAVSGHVLDDLSRHLDIS